MLFAVLLSENACAYVYTCVHKGHVVRSTVQEYQQGIVRVNPEWNKPEYEQLIRDKFDAFDTSMAHCRATLYHW